MDAGVSHILLRRGCCLDPDYPEVTHMSKGQDRKREEKKKPAKNLKEKRAEKRSKKEGKASLI